MPSIEFMKLVSGNKPNIEEHFEKVGLWAVNFLKRQKCLKPGISFLDIGCGCGRVARYLVDKDVHYTGLDRHTGMIDWSRKAFAPVKDRFQFDHSPVKSLAYDHRDGVMGTIEATDFHFPYEDKTFDTVWLASVFTHMTLEETANYMKEIRRVSNDYARVLYSVFISANAEKYDDGNNFFFPVADLIRIASEAGFATREVSNPSPGTRTQAWYLSVPV